MATEEAKLQIENSSRRSFFLLLLRRDRERRKRSLSKIMRRLRKAPTNSLLWPACTAGRPSVWLRGNTPHRRYHRKGEKRRVRAKAGKGTGKWSVVSSDLSLHKSVFSATATETVTGFIDSLVCRKARLSGTIECFADRSTLYCRRYFNRFNGIA